MGTRSLVCFAYVLCFATICFGDGPLPMGAPIASSKEAGSRQERTRLALEQIRSTADELEKLGFQEEAKSLRDTLLKILWHETTNLNAPAPEVKHGKQAASPSLKGEELRQVNCRIHIVELSGKGVAKWKSLSKNAQNNSGPMTSIHQDGDGLLKTLQDAGDAKVLSASVIRTPLKQPAKLMVGSEFSILVPQDQGKTTVEKRQTGVRCEAVANLAENGKLQIDFSAEISERDDKRCVVTLGYQVPGLTTRRVRTDCVLNSGETLAVSVPSIPA